MIRASKCGVAAAAAERKGRKQQLGSHSLRTPAGYVGTFFCLVLLISGRFLVMMVQLVPFAVSST